MRAMIPVPALPMESIRNRSRAARARGRARAFVAVAALSVAALGAGTGVGAKIYDGVHVWLSGDKSAVIRDRSGVLMRQPMASDLRAAIARATFPVVFPVGVPAGSRVDMVTLSPAEHPSSITVSYQNGMGFKASFALLDPAVVSANDALPPAGSTRIGATYHWRVGGEVVGVLEKSISLDDVNRIKAAMVDASPPDSLAATEMMLPKIVVLGGPVRLGLAEHYRPSNGRSVLLGESNVRSLPRLADAHAPILDSRIIEATKIVYKDGDITKAAVRPHKAIAISADGVRALDAVLRSTGERRDRDCGCEILFNQPSPTTYRVWMIPLSASPTVRKYSIDARTFAVTLVTQRETRQ